LLFAKGDFYRKKVPPHSCCPSIKKGWHAYAKQKQNSAEKKQLKLCS
jgi:hypothetical protein